MVHRRPPLAARLYHVRVALEETLRRRQGDIRVRLATKLHKRADAETRVLGRKGSET